MYFLKRWKKHLFILSHLQEKYHNNNILHERGHYMIFGEEDLYKANGYNEEMTCWRRKDNELAYRLINFRTKKKNHKI